MRLIKLQSGVWIDPRRIVGIGKGRLENEVIVITQDHEVPLLFDTKEEARLAADRIAEEVNQITTLDDAKASTGSCVSASFCSKCGCILPLGRLGLCDRCAGGTIVHPDCVSITQTVGQAS